MDLWWNLANRLKKEFIIWIKIKNKNWFKFSLKENNMNKKIIMNLWEKIKRIFLKMDKAGEISFITENMQSTKYKLNISHSLYLTLKNIKVLEGLLPFALFYMRISHQVEIYILKIKLYRWKLRKNNDWFAQCLKKLYKELIIITFLLIHFSKR